MTSLNPTQIKSKDLISPNYFYDKSAIKVGSIFSDCEILKLVGRESVQIGIKDNCYFKHLSINYHCNKLKLETCEELEIKSHNEIKLKSEDAIEFEPSGYCKKLGICSNECYIKLWATDDLNIESCGDIRLRPECGSVISLQNNIEVPCGHNLTFLTTNSQINFADSSFIKTAGKTQYYIHDDDYTLNLTDNGKTIYMDTNNTIYVPDTNSINFPIGTSITIIAGSQDIYITQDNNNVIIYGNQYGVFCGAISSWTIPQFTTGILSLVNNNTWVLTAPNMRITIL
jgi:hypothetical protein